MWAAAKNNSLTNSEELLSKKTQLGSRDRNPAVVFSNCCWLGYLAMATGSAKLGLMEAVCQPSVAWRRSEMRFFLKHHVKKYWNNLVNALPMLLILFCSWWIEQGVSLIFEFLTQNSKEKIVTKKEVNKSRGCVHSVADCSVYGWEVTVLTVCSQFWLGYCWNRNILKGNI